MKPPLQASLSDGGESVYYTYVVYRSFKHPPAIRPIQVRSSGMA